MSARILHFSPAPQEPIRLTMPPVDRDYPRGMTVTLLVAMVLSSGSVVVLGVMVGRFFHG